MQHFKWKLIINLSHSRLFVNYFVKKSKFESGPEKIIQPEIVVELGVKIVETRYQSKSKKKTFTGLKRSTNLAGFKVRFETLFFTRIKFIKMS